MAAQSVVTSQPCWARLGLASQRDICLHISALLNVSLNTGFYFIVYYSSCLCYYSEQSILNRLTCRR